MGSYTVLAWRSAPLCPVQSVCVSACVCAVYTPNEALDTQISQIFSVIYYCYLLCL